MNRHEPASTMFPGYPRFLTPPTESSSVEESENNKGPGFPRGLRIHVGAEGFEPP